MLASHMRMAFSNMAWNTGSRSAGEELMTLSTSAVAACCSSASASSRVRASSCFFNSISELGLLLTRALAFVPVERSLRPRVGLFAPLRDKVTSSAQSLVPFRSVQQGSSLSILTEPRDELQSPHSIISSPLFAERDVMEYRDVVRLDWFDAGKPDDLRPLLDVIGDEPAELGRRDRMDG